MFKSYYYTKIVLTLSFLILFTPTIQSYASEYDGILGNKINLDLGDNFNITKIRMLNNGKLVHVGRISRGLTTECQSQYSDGLIIQTDSETVSLDNSFTGDGIEKFRKLDSLNLEDVIESNIESDTVFAVGQATDYVQTGSGTDYSCNTQTSVGVILKYNLLGQPITNFGTSYGAVAEKFGIIPDLTASQKEYLTAIIQLDNGKLVVTGFLIDESSSRDRGFIALLNSDGTLYTAFGTSGISYIDNSKIRPFHLHKTDSEFVLFGDTPAEDGFETNNFGITSFNFDGVELNTFKGNQNFRWSSGSKEGIYREPKKLNNNFYILDGISGSNFLLLKIDFNGQSQAGFDSLLKNKLADIGVEGCSYCSGNFSIDDSGRILVAITQDVLSGPRKTFIVRIENDGTLDSSFGIEGKLEVTSEYGTSITKLDSNRFLFTGIDLDNNGNEIPFFRSFTQLSRISKPEVSKLESLNDGFRIKIDNYDQENSYSISTSAGNISFDSATATARITGLQIGRSSAVVTVSVTKNGYGTKSESVIGYSNYSESQLLELQKASEEADRLQKLEKVKAEREEKRKKSEIALMNIGDSFPAIEVYRDFGIVDILPETLYKMNEFVKSLESNLRTDIKLLQSYALFLEKEFRLNAFQDNPSVSNLVALGIRDITESNFEEVSSYLKDFSRSELSETIKVQKLVKSVNTLISIRNSIRNKGDFPSLGEVQSIGIPELISTNKSWIFSQIKKAPMEKLANLEALKSYAVELQDIADRRKARNQAIIGKIRARAKL